MLKIAIMRFGVQVWLSKYNGGQVRWFRGRATKYLPVPPRYQTEPPKYQPVPPHTDQYHQEPYWPSATKYQPVLPYTDPVSSCINQYRSILSQYHQVLTVPPHNDPAPSCINQYQ